MKLLLSLRMLHPPGFKHIFNSHVGKKKKAEIQCEEYNRKFEVKKLNFDSGET